MECWLPSAARPFVLLLNALSVLFGGDAEALEEDAVLKLVEQARAEGVLRITLLTDMQNERAQAMYRRAGFVGSPMKPMRLKLKPR